ncbi:MAG: signal peptidase I [Clostridiales bacterium]|nr:signal peptidase I [Clostridiales bacterium]
MIFFEKECIIIVNEILGKPKKKWYAIALNIVLDVLIVFIVGLILLFIFISPVKIQGASMENTLHDGQLVATWRFAPSSYSVGDVVTIKVEDKVIIKRIVAVEGEKIAFAYDEEGAICLYKYKNNEWVKQKESYVKEKATVVAGLFVGITVYDNASKITDGITIEKGKVFVLGDNRNVSADSRRYGQFKTSDIISKMIFNISENGFMNFIFTVLFPFSKGETQ